VARAFNFARRPFHDERPVLFTIGVAALATLVLIVANVRLYSGFQRETAGTALQIQSLERRRDRAVADAATSRTALNNYKVSSLAQQSRGLLKLVAERRFSWIALLARLERTLPSDVRVTRLAPRFDETGETYLDCALVGRSPDAVVRTITALSRDPAFSAVDLRSEAGPEGGAPEGFAFELFLKYRAQGSPQ
jgi:Tfp pilus assembly protein PilN